MKKLISLPLIWAMAFVAGPACGFEGHIHATVTRSGEVQNFEYIIGPKAICLKRTETDWPHAANLIERETGEITLVFPHNRSFVRLRAADSNPTPTFPGLPPPPAGIPPGIGPQSPVAKASLTPTAPMMPTMPPPPPGIGPPALATPGMSSMPHPPGMGGMTAMMPMFAMDALELRSTDERKNLLGHDCTRYEIKQHGQVMEIWATDKLLPYEPWQQNQPTSFGPRMIDEQWAQLVKAKKLFPLLAILKLEHGAEQMRFEVTKIAPQEISGANKHLFHVPAGYHELHPLPF